MARITRFTGLKQVLLRMKREQSMQGVNVERGLKKAGLFLLAKSMKEVPVEHGVLKASGFVRHKGSGFSTKVYVGYTAAYAIYVHENMDATHGEAFNMKHSADIAAGRVKARGPGQKSKFLEDPAKNPANKAKMKAFIQAGV